MRAFAIQRPDTAFATAPAKGKKRPRTTDDEHLKWLRTLPCVITGERPVEAAHIRYGSSVWAKRETGMGEKPDDKWALPLSPALHREQHDAGDEQAWWQAQGMDPLQIAAALYFATGDDEQAEVILREARRKARHL